MWGRCKDDGYRVNDKWYCDDCYDKKFDDCVYCGMNCEKDEMEETVDGLVCQIVMKTIIQNVIVVVV